ncbi:MAG: exo-alpha-sialidase [Clostridia bacterium]|nr:exo-alpha-sialidase [Clostridia bacterium]
MKIEKYFVCDTLPTANCHASTLLPLDDGSVVFAWFGGTKEGRDDVDIWYTVKDSSGFMPPEKLSRAKDIPHWNPVLFLMKSGEIRLFFKVGKKIAAWKTFYASSFDSGRTFSQPRELVPGDRSGGRGPVRNKCLRLESGRVLAPASTEHHGWVSFTDISDDDGVTWRKGRRVKTEYAVPILNSENNYSTNKIPMIQPTLWQSDDGTVHMFARTAAGRIYRSESEDEGETWREAYPTGLPNNNSGIDLVKVPDGRIFLVSNPVSENWGERSPLTVQVSADGGNTFTHFLTLEEVKKDSEFSYPAAVYHSGALHISYTYERTNIAYVKILL